MLRTIQHMDTDWLVRVAKLLTEFDAKADAEFYSAAFAIYVYGWQQRHGCETDGYIGAETWTAISQNAPTVSTGDTSDAVAALQLLLGSVKSDGIFGKQTRAATLAFQLSAGIDADGVCGRETWNALICLTKENERPKNMKQYDQRWKRVPYTSTGNKNQTIGNSGCGITCAANVVATWWDEYVTPADTAADAVANGYRTANNGTAWGYFKHLARKYGASRFAQTYDIARAEACLNSGGLVIVSVGPGVWTKGGHYILWYKSDAEYVYINDPASTDSSRAKNKKSRLRAQAKQYFCLWK